MRDSKRDTIEQLAQRIREIEQKGHVPLRFDATAEGQPDALEQIVPEEIRAGSLMELLSALPGAGAWTLALLFAKRICGERKALVIVDSQNSFYPPAACKLGIDLERTIVVRDAGARKSSAEYSVLSTQYSASCSSVAKPTARSLFAAVVQSLRCPAVGAVMSWFEKLPSLDFRRLQLAAEAGGGLGLLLRPASALRAPSFAAARLLVTPAPSGKEDVRRMHLEAVRMRGQTGRSLIVEVNHETGDVHLPTDVAAAKTVARKARASG